MKINIGKNGNNNEKLVKNGKNRNKKLKNANKKF